jgi:hypothetical protein
MPELHLSFSFRVVFLFFAAVCSVALSVFIYRITVPPISSTIRYCLISLRSIGLFLLVLLIGEPLLSLVTHSIDQPIVAVLVDNSQSMAMKDRIGHRDEVLKKTLRSDAWKQLGDQVTYYLFDEKSRHLTAFSVDSLTLKGEATDIAKALKEIKQASLSTNLQSVVLITDGNSTIGENPIYEAEELGVPVFTIGIGDTSEQRDLLIRKVLTNEITYVGTKVPVNVTMHSAGFGGERVQVSLSGDTGTLDEEILTLETGIHDYLIPLTFTPEKEGAQKFTVEVSRLPNELTLQNNRMSFFTKVLKSKLRIALIAGKPNEDVAFIRRVLVNDKNIEAITFIEQNDGRFYEGVPTAQVLNEIECLVLIGFPTVNSNSGLLQIILNAEKPMLMVLSRTINFEKLRLLDPLLPFSVQNIVGNEFQVFVSIPDVQRNNPIVRIGNGEKSVEVWSKLPPIFMLQGSFRSKPESEILATVQLQSMPLKDALIVARNVNRKKSLAILGYGLWRWQMLSDAGSGGDQILENFISNAVRWLTTREDERRVRVNPSKEVFTLQEAVEFSAQVYDENYQPVEDAQIEVRALRSGETNQCMLDPISNGQYQGTFDRLREGDYRFEAKVMLNGKEIGSDRGTFSIGGLNMEFLETRMNKPLLQQVASRAGGKYYESTNVSSLVHDVTTLSNFKPRELSKSAEYELWNSRWRFVLIIIVFASEWFMRKRSGML